MVKQRKALFVACASIVMLPAGGLVQGNAQELPVPCYAFEQDVLGNWIATESVTMDMRNGTIDIMPAHAVSVPVANILNARCP